MKHDDTTLQAAIDAACNETFQHHETLTGSDIIIDPSIKPHWSNESPARLALAKAFLAKLPEPEPILADDGRSLGQVAFEAWGNTSEDWHRSLTPNWQAAAQAVANVVLSQAIRRMEAVTEKELQNQYWKGHTYVGTSQAIERIRARLIAAARGESEQQADSTDWKARAEKAEAELSALKSSQLGILRPLSEAGPLPDGCVRMYGAYDQHEDRWSLTALKWDIDTHFADIRLPSTETPAPVNEQPKQQSSVSDLVRSIPEMALGGQMYWRDIALQIARVWWRCHMIGASLQHGDLDDDTSFSIVCEQHGGKVFHADTPENAWFKAENWLMSPDRQNFPVELGR